MPLLFPPAPALTPPIPPVNVIVPEEAFIEIKGLMDCKGGGGGGCDCETVVEICELERGNRRGEAADVSEILIRAVELLLLDGDTEILIFCCADAIEDGD